MLTHGWPAGAWLALVLLLQCLSRTAQAQVPPAAAPAIAWETPCFSEALSRAVCRNGSSLAAQNAALDGAVCGVLRVAPFMGQVHLHFFDHGPDCSSTSNGINSSATGTAARRPCSPVASDVVSYAHSSGGGPAPDPTFASLDDWQQRLSRSAGQLPTAAAAWAVSPPQLAWLAAQQAAADVGLPAASDPNLHWWDMDLGLRRLAAQGGRVVGLPYDADPLLLFYRRDALLAAGLSVPDTWDDLLAAARRLNATQATCVNSTNSSSNVTSCYGRGFCLLLPPGCAEDGAVLGAVWASMAATRGPSAGLYWDVGAAKGGPEAGGMTPRLGGPAMAAAVGAYRELARLGLPAGPPCSRLD